jgi:hexosaminidase
MSLGLQNQKVSTVSIIQKMGQVNLIKYLRRYQYLIVVFFLLTSTHLNTYGNKKINDKCPLIPFPAKSERVLSSFELTNNTAINFDREFTDQAYYLQKQLLKYNQLTVALNPTASKTRIVLKRNPAEKNKEAYSIKMNSKEILIEAADNHGIFNGATSVIQMVRLCESGNGKISLECWDIEDEPKYEWRGIMLDESRHFFGVSKVKQLIDWMALFKFNRFHWHLTDQPGWRVEIKQYPLLATIGGIGNHTDPFSAAKFYTQEDIKEVVQYAQERFIEIIPEIDMPGHAGAANKAYPEFSGGGSDKFPEFTFNPGNINVYNYLTHILKEIDCLFPSQIIHIGGDEVHYGNEKWASNQSITELMKSNKLSDLKEVESYFFRRISDSLLCMNNRVAAWDEVADYNISNKKTIVFYWRDDKPEQLQKALNKGFPIVLCPRHPMYFDYMQDTIQVHGPDWRKFSYNSLEKVYQFSPNDINVTYPENAKILGIQANVWTERIATEQRLDYMIFPRIAALSETAWTNDGNKDISNFKIRLKSHIKLFEEEGIYYLNPFTPAKTGEPVR